MKYPVFILLLLFSLTGHAEQVDSKEIERLLSTPFVKADFEKSRKLKILSRPFVTQGKILFLPEKGLVWHTTAPVEDILLIGRKQIIQLKSASAKPVQINNPVMKSISSVFIAIFSLDLAQIQSFFTLRKLTDQNGRLVYALEAKDESIRKLLGRIELSGKDRVEQVYIEEVSGDSTLVKLKNEQVDKSVFNALDRKLLEMM